MKKEKQVSKKSIDLMSLMETFITGILYDIPVIGGQKIKAFKLTAKGVYAYKEVGIKNNKLFVDGEIIVYKSNSRTLPTEELIDYIGRRPRILIKQDSQTKETYLHIAINSLEGVPISPENESEKDSNILMYVYGRDLYYKDSVLGKSVIEEYGYKPNKVTEYDAKMFLIEDQIADLKSNIVLQLLLQGRTKGLYDYYTNNLIVEEGGKKIVLDRITQNPSIGGEHNLNVARLGLRVSSKTTKVIAQESTDKSGYRTERFIVPSLDLSPLTANRFKEVRNLKKGIILLNETSAEDIVKTFYPNEVTFKEKYPKLNETNCHDIIYLSGNTDLSVSVKNPNIQVETISVKSIDSSLQDSKVQVMKAMQDAVDVGYSVYIVDDLNQIPDFLIKAADNALLLIIDHFNSLNDIKIKLTNFPTEIKYQLIKKLVALADIRKNTYLKVTPTVRDILIEDSFSLTPYSTDMLISLCNKKYYYSDLFETFLKNEDTIILKVTDNAITVTKAKTSDNDEVKVYTGHIDIHTCIQYLSEITNRSLFKELFVKGSCVFTYRLTHTEFKVVACISDTTFLVIFKKIDLNINQLSQYTEIKDLGCNSTGATLITGDRFTKGTLFSEFICNLANDLGNNHNSVLIIDNDRSIGQSTFESNHSIVLTSIFSPNLLQELVSIQKPDYLILHKVTDAEYLTAALKVVPYLKHVFITSKISNYFDFYLSFNLQKSNHILGYYLQRWVGYDKTTGKWVERKIPNIANTPTENSPYKV